MAQKHRNNDRQRDGDDGEPEEQFHITCHPSERMTTKSCFCDKAYPGKPPLEGRFNVCDGLLIWAATMSSPARWLSSARQPAFCYAAHIP